MKLLSERPKHAKKNKRTRPPVIIMLRDSTLLSLGSAPKQQPRKSPRVGAQLRESKQHCRSVASEKIDMNSVANWRTAQGMVGKNHCPANVEFVRKPLRVREQSRRTLDQRLALRVPPLAAAGARLIGRLAPRSRLRQAFLWRAWRLGLEAYNRRDLDVVAVGFQPDLEYYPYPEFVEAGLAEPCYHGPSGYRTYIEGTYEVWGADVRVEPKELIDLGDRVVVLADMPMRA